MTLLNNFNCQTFPRAQSVHSYSSLDKSFQNSSQLLFIYISTIACTRQNIFYEECIEYHQVQLSICYFWVPGATSKNTLDISHSLEMFWMRNVGLNISSFFKMLSIFVSSGGFYWHSKRCTFEFWILALPMCTKTINRSLGIAVAYTL